MSDNSVKEKNISLIIILLLIVCFLSSFVVVYFSYSSDKENYNNKDNLLFDEKYDEELFNKVKDIYHLHVFNNYEYTTLTDSNIMTLYYSTDNFEIENVDYNPAVIFYIINNVRNKEIVTSNTSLVNDGLISVDLDTLKSITYNVFGNNFKFDKSKIYDINSCPSLIYNPSSGKYDIGLSCGDTSAVSVFSKVVGVKEENNEIYLYEKVLFLFGDTVKDKYLNGEELGNVESNDSVWNYEKNASLYKYTFTKDENNIYYLKKVEYVKNT